MGVYMELGQLKIGANLAHISSSLTVTQKDNWVLDFDLEACYSSSLEDFNDQRAWQSEHLLRADYMKLDHGREELCERELLDSCTCF